MTQTKLPGTDTPLSLAADKFLLHRQAKKDATDALKVSEEDLKKAMAAVNMQAIHHAGYRFQLRNVDARIGISVREDPKA